MIVVLFDGKWVSCEWTTFSDGASNVKLGFDVPAKKYVSIFVGSKENADSVYWRVLLVQNAAKNVCGVDVKYNLRLEYLPHGRADRVFEVGNAHPLKVFSSLFSCFDKVTIYDPHSYALDELCDANVKYIEQELLFGVTCYLRDVEGGNYDAVVAPDKGAVTKAQDIARYLKVDLICAEKVRQISDGRVIDVKVPELSSKKHKRVIICDDICDGGGTFIPLAKILRDSGVEHVDLYVSHGIFSKGFGVFEGLIDNIYPFQLVGDYVTEEDLNDFNNGDA